MDDGALRRWMRKWRTAGGRDPDGQGLHPGTGPPPGGTVSPILAQVCVHDVRDSWVANGGKPHGRGEACLIRDADDGVGAFAEPGDAARFDKGWGTRRETCGRERSAATTRIIPCRRHRHAEKTRLEVLGLALRGGKARQGQEPRNRRTARPQRRSALQRGTAGCQEPRHLGLPVLVQRLHATRRGASHDDGVHGNAASRKQFFNSAMRMVRTWRNRRRPRHSDTWQGYKAVLERFKVARPRIGGRPKTRPAALKTEADLRKRVLLKSPVRATRTPGSVRGRSGNWPSYRDDFPRESFTVSNHHNS